MIWAGDDFRAQSGMIISPRTWRVFFKPRMAEFISELKIINRDVKVAYHSDGNIEPIILEFIQIGLDVLNPIQPTSMQPAKLKRQYSKNLFFLGEPSTSSIRFLSERLKTSGQRCWTGWLKSATTAV